MANVNFIRGGTSKIEATPIEDGQLLFDVDTGIIHMDNNDIRRQMSGGVTAEVTQAEYDALRPTAEYDPRAVYFISDADDKMEATDVGENNYGTVQNAVDTLKDTTSSLGTSVSQLSEAKVDKGSIISAENGTNKALIRADAEGGNLRLEKANGCHAEIDTAMMNGTNGYVRLYIGNAGTELTKNFDFNEDGSFTDGNGKNTNSFSIEPLHFEGLIIANGYAKGIGQVSGFRYKENGLSVLNFRVMISELNKSTSAFNWGLNYNEIAKGLGHTSYSVPVIGTCTYYNANGTKKDETGYGGVVYTNTPHGGFGRIYGIDNNVAKDGGWPSSSFNIGDFIEGTIYMYLN